MSLHNAVTGMMNVRVGAAGVEASGTALWSCENQLVLDTWVGREKGIPGRMNMGDMWSGTAIKRSWTKTE